MKFPGFSERTAWDTAESPLAESVRRARARGETLYDLAESNPTRCGFDYDADAILRALTDAGAMQYTPDPQGLPSARAAVVHYYTDAGAVVDVDHVVLSTSTSEAYSFLFRLLCNAGDEVLVAQPSYPLFEFLATLDDVALRSYPLFYDFGWWIDFAELERRIGPRTRAILLVHPNNPTGHFTSKQERAQLEEVCVRHGLALIVDEVFLDYALDENAAARSFAQGPHPALLFVVSGLSKVAALPQMKVGWLAAFGPEPLVKAAMSRLEVIADTFLSMSAPVQLALPVWLAGRGPMIAQIRERVRTNLAVWRAHGFEPLPVQAGWNAVWRLPAWLDARPEALVEQAGVIVHAGEFYGFPARGWIVVSLIVDPVACAAGVGRMQRWAEEQAPAQ